MRSYSKLSTVHFVATDHWQAQEMGLLIQSAAISEVGEALFIKMGLCPSLLFLTQRLFFVGNVMIRICVLSRVNMLNFH